MARAHMCKTRNNCQAGMQPAVHKSKNTGSVLFNTTTRYTTIKSKAKQSQAKQQSKAAKQSKARRDAGRSTDPLYPFFFLPTNNRRKTNAQHTRKPLLYRWRGSQNHRELPCICTHHKQRRHTTSPQGNRTVTRRDFSAQPGKESPALALLPPRPPPGRCCWHRSWRRRCWRSWCPCRRRHCRHRWAPSSSSSSSSQPRGCTSAGPWRRCPRSCSCRPRPGAATQPREGKNAVMSRPST